jgi:hypothetical protein
MKASILIPLFLAAAVSLATGQDKPRKSLTFPPGAKTPEQAIPMAADEPSAAMTSFFSLVARNQIDEAYAALTKGSKIAERPEELKTLKAKTIEAIELFGPINGYDLIETKNVGQSLTRRTCVSLGRDFPLRWRFYFYRTGTAWRLVDIRVDDHLSGVFGEGDEPRAPDAKP